GGGVHGRGGRGGGAADRVRAGAVGGRGGGAGGGRVRRGPQGDRRCARRPAARHGRRPARLRRGSGAGGRDDPARGRPVAPRAERAVRASGREQRPTPADPGGGRRRAAPRPPPVTGGQRPSLRKSQLVILSGTRRSQAWRPSWANGPPPR